MYRSEIVFCFVLCAAAGECTRARVCLCALAMLIGSVAPFGNIQQITFAVRYILFIPNGVLLLLFAAQIDRLANVSYLCSP